MVRPARYPDRPEPIKLNYRKYNNAHWTRRRSCWRGRPRTMKLVCAVGGAEKETEGCGGAGVRPRKERRPWSPGPIDELIATLREATLGPLHPGRHGLDPLPDNRPRVKIQLPVFKGISGERPDAHLLAAEDWMVAM